MNPWLFVPKPPLSPVHEQAVKRLRPHLIAPFRETDREPPIVTNLVFRVVTDTVLPFLTMFSNISVLRRRRVRFPGIRVVYGTTDSEWVDTIMIYVTGKFVLCGLRSEMAAVRALQHLRLDLQQCGIPIGLSMFTPVNVVVRMWLPFCIDIQAAMASKTLANATFVKKDFPGLIFVVQRVHVLAFCNGRCVLTGAGDCVEAAAVRDQVEALLEPFSCAAMPVDRTKKPRGSAGGTKRVLKTSETKPKESAPKRATQAKRRGRRQQPAATVIGEPVRRKNVAFQLNERIVLRPNLE